MNIKLEIEKVKSRIFLLMGIVSIKDITYANLITLINNNDLVVNQKYKIIDFATVHYLQDCANYDQNTSVIITGVNEPLIVTAISNSQIDLIAKSELYPNDIIYYDWNANNYIWDYAFYNMYNWEEDATLIPNFKGVIIFRHDTIQNNSAGYDFRNARTRMYHEALPVYSVGTTYALAYFIKYNNVFYASRVAGNIGNQPDISPTFWKKIMGLDITNYISMGYRVGDSRGYLDIPVDTNDFIDVLTFQPHSSNNYESQFRNIHITPVKDDSNFWWNTATILSNCVLFGHNETYKQFEDVIIHWSNNIVMLGGSYSTKFDGVYNLLLGNGAIRNTIKGATRGLIIGENFLDNELNSAFSHWSCVGENFNKNTIKFTEMDMRPVNATHLYNNYNCEVFKNSSGVAKLSYINGSNVLTIVDPTT